jgi:hypothetical protein
MTRTSNAEHQKPNNQTPIIHFSNRDRRFRIADSWNRVFVAVRLEK